MKRLWRVAAGSLLACGSLAACGSYHSDEELEAAAGASAVLSGGSATDPTGGSATGPSGAGGGSSAGSAAAGGGSSGTGAGQAGGGTGAGVGGTGSNPAGGPAGGAGNGEPIRIGEVGLYSGIGGAVFTSQSQAVRAWVEHVNASGGINGHPVELTVVDDGGDPARHRSAVQQLIDQGVIAFVGNAETLTGRGSMDLIEAHRIPVIGSDTGSPHYYESAMYFPEGSNANPKFYADLAAAAAYATANGLTRLATLTCTEAQSCGDADTLYSARAADFGVEVVSRARVSIAQPDFTSECLGARNNQAEVFLIVLDGPSAARLAQSCARVGLRIPITMSSSSPGAATDPNIPAAVFASVVFPWTLADSPARAEFREVFGRFPNARFDTQSAGGWAAAHIFELAASRTIGPNDQPTAEAVLEGLWSFQGETLGGLTAPLTFTRDQPAPQVTCYFLMVTRDGEWQAENGAQATCPPF